MTNAELLDEDPGDIARGFRRQGDTWGCLLCGAVFENGIVYTVDGTQYEAFRAVREHVRLEHAPVFRCLLSALRDQLSLTERQEEILGLMFDGCGDREIASRLSLGDNTSSVRNLRFQFKERERQAKAFLALMDSFRAERRDTKTQSAAVPPPAGATLADERFAITEQERYAVVKTYFNADGSLKEFPVREKRKLIVLMEITKRFERGREYTEKEVNETIAWRDFATVRRYLIEYGLLDRSQDCARYWVKEGKRHNGEQLPE